jgi:hypothetical protein
MACKTCKELLDACKSAVRLFTDAKRRCQGLLGDDFQLALKKLQRLHLACMDASAAMTAHCRQDHGLGFPHHGSGASAAKD